MKIDVNRVLISGLVTKKPENFSKDPSKQWWNIPIEVKDVRGPERIPVSQTISISVFDPTKSALIQSLNVGDTILVEGKLNVSTMKTQNGSDRLVVKVVNSLNHVLELLVKNDNPNSGSTDDISDDYLPY